MYPRTPEGDAMQARMLKSLTSKRWVTHKSRIWASGGEIVEDPEFPDDPRYNKRVRKITKSEKYNPSDPNHLGRELITLDGKKHVVLEPTRWCGMRAD